MSMKEMGQRARAAARSLARASADQKNAVLLALADRLMADRAEILTANARDMAAAQAGQLYPAMLDRLTLNEARLAAMASDVRNVAALPDPVGEKFDAATRPNGLALYKQRVPIGVLGVIYEARPNVTVDAACLCLKTGNAVILRGGSAAMHSNRILSEVVQGAVIEAGLPREAIAYLTPDRRELDELLEQRRYVDLVIPRGGEDLKDYLMECSKVPVIYAAGGNCHVYVDAAADLDKAVPIIVNAKCQRPGVCNAAETLLVHRDVAAAFLPRAVEELKRRGVELVVDKAAADLLGDPTLKRANKTHFETEFLALKLAVRVVDSLDDALEHIATYGTRHSEAIVTEDLGAARRFTAEVDAACVYVNASTRFTDGGEFGLGAEMGISTQKLHVRGPIALQELTCVKYELWGDGQVRP